MSNSTNTAIARGEQATRNQERLYAAQEGFMQRQAEATFKKDMVEANCKAVKASGEGIKGLV